MKVFITSDTHFGHANIIKYCNRPFTSAEEMDTEMIRRWNETVSPEDTVWHLGDFCMGNHSNIKKYLSRLNGKINLVMGNHDRLNQYQYIKLGFNRVYDRPIIINRRFILSHAPIFQADLVNTNFINLYGHVHNHPDYENLTPYSSCLCVERTDYRPVDINTVFERFSNNNPTNQ